MYKNRIFICTIGWYIVDNTLYFRSIYVANIYENIYNIHVYPKIAIIEEFIDCI